MVHLHLDPLGGVAGDMFAAALSDVDNSLADGLVPLLRSAGLRDDVTAAFVDHRDEVFVGRRFVVVDPREKNLAVPGRFVMQTPAHAHNHTPFQDILRDLEKSALTPGAKSRAKDIYTRLAQAEASVHGMSLDEVAFHEVGAQDSVADIVTAAVMLDRLEEKHGPLTTSIASLPLGSGRVRTAHGELPVPAPATLVLLRGLVTHDDQRLGERVTPTGAAIVQHLQPQQRKAGVVVTDGKGFGTKVFAGLSNILRITLSQPVSSTQAPSPWSERAMLVLSAEIDDMTAEEFAVAADVVRGVAGVVDVCFVPVTMKKARPATQLQVIVHVEHRDAAVAAVFAQTTTLGVRVAEVIRCELERSLVTVDDGARAKTAVRPGGATTKVDVDDIRGATLAERRRRRQSLER